MSVDRAARPPATMAGSATKSMDSTAGSFEDKLFDFAKPPLVGAAMVGGVPATFAALTNSMAASDGAEKVCNTGRAFRRGATVGAVLGAAVVISKEIL